MSDLSGLLEFAVDLAERAGDVAMQLYGGRLTADRKLDETPVTRADRDAEQRCRALIAERFPDDGVLGEEFGESPSRSGRRWILDPIDGTRTFIHGVPLFGVLVALESGDEGVLGVMHFPALGETVAAARGAGCYWNGARCRVSEVDDLSRALVLTTDVEHAEREGRRAAWDALAARAALARTWGDCYGHALVATGRAEVMVDPVLALWDAAALAPIVTEAGGRLTDWRGASGHRVGSGISTNAALADVARGVLGVPEPAQGVGDDGPVAQ